MIIFLFFIILVLVSIISTFLLRNYALKKSIIDIPNSRSSHSTPTPRGGGVAIVVCFLLSLPLLKILGYLDTPLMWAILVSGGGIALLGFLDDHGHIAARWRLLGHFAGAIWIVFLLNGLPPLNFLGLSIDFSWLGNVLAVFYLVWILNLYNFMDGIDGIASIEAITVSTAGAIFYYAIGKPEFSILPIALASSVFGFLVWNFPPAKIFMGDAGSGFLGLVLGALSLHAAWIESQLFWAWLIMLGVFIVDATTTLAIRLVQGEKLYEAHRSHAYQYASRFYGAHKPISIAIGLINCIWLFPLALCVALLKIDGFLATLIAYSPLLFLAVKFNAGKREK